MGMSTNRLGNPSCYDGNLDCVVIGYNELPFNAYESFLRQYGENSEAYRDLKFSFVDLGGSKLDYVGLLNRALIDAGSVTTPNQLKSGDIPNLAAVYLTSFLRRRGIATEYINLFQSEKEKLIDCLSRQPVCVAITTTFYVVNLPVNEVVEFIRKYNQTVKIVVGGPLIANHTRNNEADPGALKAALDDTGADIFVVEGQGELTLSSIVRCLKEGGDLSLVPNIIFYDSGRFRRTPALPENNSLDDDFISWDQFDDAALGRTLQTRTARSCAFNCSFCNYPTRAGKLTLASLDTFERELDSMHRIGNVQNVVFIDDTFNVPLPRFKDLCRLLIRKNYQFNWFSYFRCSNSDDEAVELMARSGCKGVFLGIESGSPTILKNMNKAATIEKYATGIEALHKNGILTFGSFIIGFPGETEDTVKETADFIRQTRPSYYRAQMWYCEPGTPIENHRARYEIEGEGFVWSHSTMDSSEAMDHIDRLFLTIDESQWLPQWSFDFWIIPYLMGRGISLDRFNEFMICANKMLALEIAFVPESKKIDMQNRYMRALVDKAGRWGVLS
jgi:radical SAM PhpK family P-methyltransferase